VVVTIEIDISGDNILKLPVKPREQVGDRFLVDVPYSKCNHWQGPFEVDEKGGKCKCLKCGDEVSAIFVLTELMKQESRWMRTREAYLGELKRLGERSRTKCQHCGEMTRISRS
jgi:hypothetical protein